MCLCVTERKEREDNRIDLSRLPQVCMWWESQNVGTADALTKTVSHFLQIGKEPDVKARVPIIFKNNCQILDEGCMHFNSRMTQIPLYCVQIITDE